MNFSSSVNEIALVSVVFISDSTAVVTWFAVKFGRSISLLLLLSSLSGRWNCGCFSIGDICLS